MNYCFFFLSLYNLPDLVAYSVITYLFMLGTKCMGILEETWERVNHSDVKSGCFRLPDSEF